MTLPSSLERVEAVDAVVNEVVFFFVVFLVVLTSGCIVQGLLLMVLVDWFSIETIGYN